MLALGDVRVSYGEARALRGVSLEVPQGAIVALIGANGAGKSTTLKTVAGIVRPSGGQVRFWGDDISLLSPQSIVDLRISMVPEGRRLFTKMTVLENLQLGAYTKRARPKAGDSLDRVLDLFQPLKERLQQPAGVLSGGQQQMLAIGRALMSRPKLLMLDEPSLGLAPLVVRLMFSVVRTLREQGVTVLLVEQNVRQSLELADWGFVIRNGKIALQGQGGELLANPEVKAAFLGMGGRA